MQVSWGSPTQVEAAKILLTAALRNPLNQKFFLIGDRDVPL